MTDTIRVYVWPSDSSGTDSLAQMARTAIDEAMAPQFSEMTIQVYDYSHWPAFDDSGYSSGSALIDGFEAHIHQYVTVNHGPPDPNDVHLLISDTANALNDVPVGMMRGSVGPGRGTFWGDGAAGFVDHWSYSLGALYNDMQGSFENTVLHEVYHALTDDDLAYYESPDWYCRDDDEDSSPDHSLGRVYDVGSDAVSPMATWYTPWAANDIPCNSCMNTENSNAFNVSHDFTACATSEAEKHLTEQF